MCARIKKLQFSAISLSAKGGSKESVAHVHFLGGTPEIAHILEKPQIRQFEWAKLPVTVVDSCNKVVVVSCVSALPN
jgi:hypothetical protein